MSSHATTTTPASDDSPQHLNLHLKSGDYFAYLATLMGFFQEIDLSKEIDMKNITHIAKEMRDELRFMHLHYEIVPKKAKNRKARKWLARGGLREWVRSAFARSR